MRQLVAVRRAPCAAPPCRAPCAAPLRAGRPVAASLVTPAPPVTQVPWDGYQPLDIKDKVLAGERPRMVRTMPHACEGLLRKAWHQNGKLRPTFSQMIETLQAVEETLPMGSALLLGGMVPRDSLDDFAGLGL